MSDYGNFRVLLDEPAEHPSLGFDAYADAFAEVIINSDPRFAIGIFGDWGSGKTTLMKAVWRRLDSPSIVRVWFNAWRYEREEHLIVPMLDTLREGLMEWAPSSDGDEPQRASAREAAEKIGRAARALMASFSLKASIPLGVAKIDAAFDPSKVMESFDASTVAEEPSSFYHASFRAMSEAISDFVRSPSARQDASSRFTSDAITNRVVVFIDDLDRCLPANALEVLESMKLFFDLEGFIFVVGLDQNVIEGAIESKYMGQHSVRPSVSVQDMDEPTAAHGQPFAPERAGPPVSGTDYIKKIFQVPFGLPRIATDQLAPFFSYLTSDGQLPKEQVYDFRNTVQRHLPYMFAEGVINPREVKRLLNTYTLQMKMLSRRAVPGGVDPNVVLALQTLAFRTDWQRLYLQLTADPELFIEAVVEALRGPEGPERFWLSSDPLPNSFLQYLRDVGSPLLTAQLRPYISSVEATRSSDPGLVEVQGMVLRMVRALDQVRAPGDVTPNEVNGFHGFVERLRQEISRRQSTAGGHEMAVVVDKLERALKDLSPSVPEDRLRETVASMRSLLERLDDDLRQMRRHTGIGAMR